MVLHNRVRRIGSSQLIPGAGGEAQEGGAGGGQGLVE